MRETTALPPPLDAAPASVAAAPALSPVERLEALVLKELGAEEAVRAALGTRPRPRYDAERCARTLSVFTQTLKSLQGMRAAAGTSGDVSDDSMPEDIDAFREELARRIRGFIENRVGSERMALDRRMAGLTDDEVKELIQVGQERGIQALLRPPAAEEDDGLD